MPAPSVWDERVRVCGIPSRHPGSSAWTAQWRPGMRARALLASVLPGRLDGRVRDRIIAESGGNPLALLELPRGATAADLAGAAPGGDQTAAAAACGRRARRRRRAAVAGAPGPPSRPPAARP